MRFILHLRGEEKEESTWVHFLRRGGRTRLRVCYLRCGKAHSLEEGAPMEEEALT
jgi:hypothetical protein